MTPIEASLYVGMHSGKLLWVNLFGEPFFAEDGVVSKVCPEDGVVEVVCPEGEFDPEKLEDWCTMAPLREQWESVHGSLPEGFHLVPRIPFCLNGNYDEENLMALSHEEAAALYKDIRQNLSGLKHRQNVLFGYVGSPK